MSARVLNPPPEGRAESPALPEQQPLFPDAILWLLAAPELVEVMSVIPYHPEEPDDEDEDIVVPTGPRYLHGHYIRGTARVPTAGRRRALAQALIRANRE